MRNSSCWDFTVICMQQRQVEHGCFHRAITFNTCSSHVILPLRLSLPVSSLRSTPYFAPVNANTLLNLTVSLGAPLSKRQISLISLVVVVVVIFLASHRTLVAANLLFSFRAENFLESVNLILSLYTARVIDGVFLVSCM